MADINYEYTPVTIIRGDSTVIDNTPIIDGQILFDESRKCLLMDNGEIRSKYSGLGANSNLATLEDTTTATHPYVKGDYVVVEGALYLVLSAIAIGDTFTVGINIRQVTVGEELTQIQTDLTGNYLGNAIPFRFGIDSNGDYGYIKAGADTVTPFRTNHTGTYTATERGAALDMGQYHTYRYVNTNGVPNNNTQVANFANNVTTYDLGLTNAYRYVTVNVPSYRYQAWSADEVISNVTKTSTTLVVGQYTVFVFNAFSGVDYSYSNRECITSLANASGNSMDGGLITHTYEKGVTTYAYNVTITNPTYLNFNYYCQENQAREAMYGFIIYKNA